MRSRREGLHIHVYYKHIHTYICICVRNVRNQRVIKINVIEKIRCRNFMQARGPPRFGIGAESEVVSGLGSGYKPL